MTLHLKNIDADLDQKALTGVLNYGPSTSLELSDIPSHKVMPRPQPKRNGFTPYRSVGKYTLDVILVLMAAPIVLPVILLMAIFVSRDGCNPFYSQYRIGKNGRVFTMWKMRTMVPNAKAKLNAYLMSNPEAMAEWNATQKLKNDPRITPIGALLRKTSLDELPQLLNVLKDEMSIVGPRPIMDDQQDLYSGEAYYRLNPGITGLWQISDRNECEFADRVKFDDEYEGRLTLLNDITIILRTFGVVLRGTGY